jgi:hypothetical protein
MGCIVHYTYKSTFRNVQKQIDITIRIVIRTREENNTIQSESGIIITVQGICGRNSCLNSVSRHMKYHPFQCKKCPPALPQNSNS